MLSRVHPAPLEIIDMGAEGSRDRLLEWYSPPQATWLRVNLVTSVSGSAVGTDGTSNSLTSATDRRILGVIRELSDVVLVGAESVRVEGYQLPRTARLAIVTGSGNFAGHRFSPEETERITVICPPDVADAVRGELPGAEVLAVGAPAERLSPASIVDSLHAAGHTSIVCEGGPSLASALLGAGLVDELCLTTSPVLSDSSPAAFSATGLGEQGLELRQLLLDDASFLFARWLTRSPQSTP
ncbi:dihydrofolate reductase family protein [Leifsonia sp. AK011]|uniref:dihydrofolate reductase family protein n=1 Tax=Leifsonia sp. AK011 TaxID=2723075 RepID=UPI00211B96C3|nr:dihydrofolate reductase family protein [Leifsonia sp. AK011]